jgi:hypothetical protein
VGALIKHGWLRGFGPAGWIKGIRARRLFCSNRGSRPGCGRTVSVFFDCVLNRLSLTTSLLWRFLVAGLRMSIKSAWESLPSSASRSLTTAYRIHRRVRMDMPRLRSELTRIHPPPEAISSSDPFAALVTHLESILVKDGSGSDPIATLQARSQRHFFAIPDPAS